MKRLLTAVLSLLIIGAVLVGCNENTNKEPPTIPVIADEVTYTVKFFVNGIDATKDFENVTDGLILLGFAGDGVDLTDEISAKLPKGYFLDREKSKLSATLPEDNSLVLEAHLNLDYSNVSYDFTIDNPYVKYIVSAIGSTTVSGVLADPKASGGYALVAERGNGDGGIAIHFDAKPVADFDRILMRIYVSNAQKYIIRANGNVDLGELKLGAYRVYDLKPLLETNGITTLEKIELIDGDGTSGTISVDAINFVKTGTTADVDSSFLVKRDENSVYISDFNNPEIMKLLEIIGVNHQGDSVPEMGKYELSEMVYYPANISNRFLGIKLETTNVTGVKYNLPQKLDLTKMDEMVIRFGASAWHGGSVSSFFHFTNDDNLFNIIKYCKVYLNDLEPTDNDRGYPSRDHLDDFNYYRCLLVLDVEKFVKDTGIETIDGIIFTAPSNSAAKFHILDEIYFTNLEKAEEPAIPSIHFTTANVDGNGYEITDTAHGLMIREKSWSYANYMLSNPISGADIQTLTVRFKESSTEQAIMQLMSSSFEIFVNLTKAKAGDPYVISKTTDEYGFTMLKLDFTKLPSESWTITDRGNLDLTEIRIGSSHQPGAPIFDYVAFNG